MAKFCTNCGNPLETNARFCASCGAPSEEIRQDGVGRTPVSSPVQTNKANNSATPPVRNKKKISVILIIAALLVILFGIQSMALNIIGKTTTATVIKATLDTRTYGGNNMPDPNRYNVIYEFSVDGERHTGNANHIFKTGVRSTQTVRVLYMPFMPGINAVEGDTKITGGLIMTGLGVLLLVLSIKGKVRVTRRY